MQAVELLEKPDSSGDLDNLILRLTPPLSSPANHEFTNAFNTTCHRFSVPGDILDRFFGRFSVGSKRKLKTEEAKMMRSRVVNTMFKWLKTNPHLIDETVIAKLRKFVDKKLRTDSFFSSQINTLEDELTNFSQYEFPSNIVRKLPDRFLPFEHHPFSIVLQYDEQLIANQLTLVEFDIYLKIKEMELMNQAWSKEKYFYLSQNVVQLILRANRTSFWVASCILLQPKVKDRTKLIQKFINIAKHLLDLNNYNTLMGIVAGLNTVSISRLKLSFGPVKKNFTEQWDQIMELMNPSNSFKRLRTSLDEAGPQALPYIGMYLSDLTFMEDGNADEITKEDGTKLINFSKHFMIYKAIGSLRAYQLSAKYNLQKVDSVFNILSDLPSLLEEDLYQLSLIREPRDATQ
uniref:Ras-GEF domain-containing protein n=1 Tax=Arcella intermedia TaxID=1963864 RepID=A0A6B2L5N5_9EUKA